MIPVWGKLCSDSFWEAAETSMQNCKYICHWPTATYINRISIILFISMVHRHRGLIAILIPVFTVYELLGGETSRQFALTLYDTRANNLLPFQFYWCWCCKWWKFTSLVLFGISLRIILVVFALPSTSPIHEAQVIFDWSHIFGIEIPWSPIAQHKFSMKQFDNFLNIWKISIFSHCRNVHGALQGLRVYKKSFSAL